MTENINEKIKSLIKDHKHLTLEHQWLLLMGAAHMNAEVCNTEEFNRWYDANKIWMRATMLKLQKLKLQE